MSEPQEFYRTEKKRCEQERISLRRKSRLFSLFRMGLFLILISASYFFYHHTIAFAGILAAGSVGFIILVINHEKLVSQIRFLEQLIEINGLEIEVQKGNLDDLPDGSEFVDVNHFYSNDIDLFGKNSFFQFLNRTATKSGKEALRKLLLSNNIEHIKSKQDVIAELAPQVSWRQKFLAHAKMVSPGVDDQTVVTWINTYRSFLPEMMGRLPMIFASLSVLNILLVIFNLMPFYFLASWFFLGLLITLPFFKRMNHLYLEAGRIKATFKQYHPLLREIEALSLDASLASEQQKNISTQGKRASQLVKEFSKILDAFDQRNNMLFGILGNGLLLWDIRQTSNIDKWVGSYRMQVESWFSVIAYFDAQISLSNYAYNHPGHHYPELLIGEDVIIAESLGHPLLKMSGRVSNDFSIKKKEFYIVTGANMAGKSTFLRTISLGIVMANIGMPVCAKKMSYSPVKLITSMRTSDSLARESSYFHAEIMRLRFIVEHIKDEAYFIILDEILKGTNSRDKAMGSRKFVEKLVRSGSTGLIATHDLSLCDIEKKYPQIHNQYFDAKIKNENLYFDYKLKKGICTNMNASFLLQKMEII